MSNEVLQRTRAREIAPDYVETLLNSLTSDQVRSALVSLRGGSIPGFRNKNDLDAAVIGCGKSRDLIIKTLLGIEALTPTRHCILNRFQGDADYSSLLGMNFGSFIGLTFKAVHQQESEGYLSITFEHDVEVIEWAYENNDAHSDVKRKKIYRLRHPVILRLNKKTNVALFLFPGFSQGHAQRRENRLNYGQIIGNLISALSTKSNISFSPIPIEGCLNSLQSGDSPRVRIVGGDFEAASGRLSLTSGADQKSVSEMLGDLFGAHLPEAFRAQVKAAAADVLKEVTTFNALAFWIEEKVLTRVRSLDVGAEFQFIWHNTSSSLAAINRIADLLASLSVQLSLETKKNVWDFLLSLEGGKKVTLSFLQTKTNESFEVVKQSVLVGIKAGILRSVYRLNSHATFLETHNNWTPQLRELSKKFRTIDDEFLDGSDPRNIEVAFERVAKERAV